jgi:hypothetical protein
MKPGAATVDIGERHKPFLLPALMSYLSVYLMLLLLDQRNNAIRTLQCCTHSFSPQFSIQKFRPCPVRK